MPRARIGKLFHLTPLVDSLGDAEYFFNRVFSPLCMMRNYSTHWHRHAAIYIIGETSIEPMECLPGPATRATSWFRYVERFGPRVHNMAFYVDHIEDLAQRLEEAGVRITDGGSGQPTVFCHPKDTPGHARVPPRRRGHVGAARPALPSRVAGVPATRTGATSAGPAADVAHHDRGRTTSRRPRSSTSTCSTRRRFPSRPPPWREAAPGTPGG